LAQAEGFIARVVKLVDAGDSKSPAARRAGSIPAPGTSAGPSSDGRAYFFVVQNSLVAASCNLDIIPELIGRG
jgi:hypothetical protein